MRLVAGLANPGSRYAETRHNAGAAAVRVLIDRHGGSLRRARRFIPAEVCELHVGGERAVLAVPRTFMNESGRSVAPLLRYYRVEPSDLLVVHDDIDLPFGKLRAQFGRGHGGNNGVRSIIRSLGTSDFWRLKLGVGRPPGRMDPADFVLRPFAPAERDDAELMVEHAADLVEIYAARGGEAARERAGELNAQD